MKTIYSAILATEQTVAEAFPDLTPRLPDDIRFIHTQELENQYPEDEPQDRENRAAEELGAYFLIGIGVSLESGNVHDLRAADYDDWTTENESGRSGFNGDIIVFDETRRGALELSSMGIRVDREALLRQLAIRGNEERKSLLFHRRLLAGDSDVPE